MQGAWKGSPARTKTATERGPRVFMMDLLAIVPYYTAYLSRALRAEGADVTVGSISYYLDPTCFRSRGLRLDPGLMDVVGRFRLPRLPRRVLKLPEALVNLAALAMRFAVQPPEIVHVQFLPMLRWRLPLDLWLLRLCRRRGSRIVLTVHDLLPHDTADRYRELYRGLYGFADGLICHSATVEERLRTEFGVSAERIAVIPHGPFFYDVRAGDLPSGDLRSSGDLASGGGEASTRKRFGVAAGAEVVLWQGILFPYKGVDLLLEAWARVEAESSTACLVVAGTGSPELVGAVEEQIGRLGLKRVRLHPRFLSTEELVALYRLAAVAAYPYRAITTSGAVATGLALGKAIVASDLPVFRELLTDGVTARLVDPTDAFALAGALLELLERKELRREMEARVRAMEFGERSWMAIAAQTMAVYRGLEQIS